jgi:hypothetical protein
VLITLHTIYQGVRRAPVLRDIASKIAHFVELFDYECIYLINYAGVPREKCVSINDGADGGDNFYDKDKAKQALGLQGRDIILNMGIMAEHKGMNILAKATIEAAKQRPNLLFLGVGTNA